MFLPTINSLDGTTHSPMTIRNFMAAAWGLLASSWLLLVWQIVAFLTNSIPGHILPLVYLTSGTEEAIPVAYTWTMRMGILSVLAFVASLILLAGVQLRLRYIREDKNRSTK